MMAKTCILGDIPTSALKEASWLVAKLPWPEGSEVRILFVPSYYMSESNMGGGIMTKATVEDSQTTSIHGYIVPKAPFVIVVVSRDWQRVLAHELKHLSDCYLAEGWEHDSRRQQQANRFANECYPIGGPDNDD